MGRPMLPAPPVKGKIGASRLLVSLFEKRPHDLFLGLDFPPLSTKKGAVFLKIGVGLLTYANSRSVTAFHLRFIRFITDK
jgi:hypothetical protein